MVHTSNYQSNTPVNELDLPTLIDPVIIKAARTIYRVHSEYLSEQFYRPFGVAVDRHTYRGKPIYHPKPILLFGECFVPIEQVITDN